MAPKKKEKDGGARHLSGPLSEKMDPALADASVSVGFDRKMAYADILGSLAHASMLEDIGVLTTGEAVKISKGLMSILEEVVGDRKPNFKWKRSLEDVHMNIERELIERIGEPGEKLHTARSRNDQVVLDELLYLQAESYNLMNLLFRLRAALLDRAEEAGEAPMPGYTHLQRAQPVLLAHHLMAYYHAFSRDYDRTAFLFTFIDTMPLGSGALAGTPIPIKPEKVADAVFFDKISPNSMDSVASRDKILEFLYIGAVTGVNLSRLAEELVLWATAEFGFVRFPDSLCTTSSMMPQKRNPDGAELVRGKCGRLIGNLVSVMTTLKGLPLTYNRDLQEDKEPLFDTCETLRLSLELAISMVKKVQFNLPRLREAAEDPYMGATDLADHLVMRGVPFREAHGQVGALVAMALAEKKALRDLSPSELAAFCPKADPSILSRLDAMSLINARNTTPGGTAPERVREQIKLARARMEEQKSESDHEL
ncbi:MAG: argininosuccinate lyase [Deltaproteobacteria bacterium]|jgi:argininosuccinate lyase|nr:argininosuccinate lyase [Deltaproteobacteria bacterium]